MCSLPTNHVFPPILSTLLTNSLTTVLKPPSRDDELSHCPAAVLSILRTHPESLIRLARSKLYSWPYAQVPACWRRLFVDASIVQAIHITQKNLAIECEKDSTKHEVITGAIENGLAGRRILRNGDWRKRVYEEDDWVQQVVNLLDMAIIMAGAETRREMIEAIIEHLRLYLSHETLTLPKHSQNDEPSQPKRRKLSSSHAQYNDTFPISKKLQQLPSIRYPIPSASAPSLWTFEQHLQKQGGPMVIKGALGHWPALNERPWRSPRYLMERTFGGRRLVPVEVGRSYTDEGWGQKVMHFGEFMDEYVLEGRTVDEDAERSTAHGHDQTNSDNERRGQSQLGYLAQHDLFSQIPSLRNDISVPDYCYTDPPPTPKIAGKDPPSRLSEPLLNAWFGPPGTVSPLHTDPYYNILCQIVGKKYVRLYNPDQSDRLYPRGDESGVDMSNTSEVDAEGQETELEEHFPLFRSAEYVETILQEGDCLYIPVGWWHYVRSLTVSFSVSFWWN